MSISDELIAIASPTLSITALGEPDIVSSLKDLEFGPAVFHKRREQWSRGELRMSSDPMPSWSRSSGAARRTSGSTDALKKLDEVLGAENVDDDDYVWRTYLNDIHRKMTEGSRVKKGLKLSQAVRILKIGWKRDGTWNGEEPSAAGNSNVIARAAAVSSSTTATTSSKTRRDIPSFIRTQKPRIKTDLSPTDFLRERKFSFSNGIR